MTDRRMTTQHPFFGRDPDSYNIDLDTDSDVSDAPDGSGRPGIRIASGAIAFWRAQQQSPCTVREAATVFCMPEAAVVECVEYDPWLFLRTVDRPDMGDWLIEVDGE